MSLDERNAELDEKLEHNPIDEQIAALMKAGKTLRMVVVILAFVVAGLVYGWWGNHNLAIKAENNRDSIMRNCETSNEARKNQRQLWAYVTDLTPKEPRTPEENQRIVEFQKFIDETFKLRNCEEEINKTN